MLYCLSSLEASAPGFAVAQQQSIWQEHVLSLQLVWCHAGVCDAILDGQWMAGHDHTIAAHAPWAAALWQWLLGLAARCSRYL